MRYIFGLFIFTIILVQCNTTAIQQNLPPQFVSTVQYEKTITNPAAKDAYLLKLREENLQNQAILWWVDYKRALNWKNIDNQISCRLFRELAQEKKFALQRLANLRSFETCQLRAQDYQNLYEYNWLDREPWLEKFWIELAYSKAEASKDSLRLLELLPKKADLARTQKEKINYLQAAMQSAVDLGDEQSRMHLETKLYKISPRLKPNPKRSEYFQVAYDYRRDRDFDKARSYYKRILKAKSSSFADRWKAIKGIRITYKIQRKKDLYILYSHKLAEFAERNWKQNKKNSYLAQKYLDAKILLARTLWTEGRIQETKEILYQLSVEMKSRKNLGEVYWILARMAEERRNFSKAVYYSKKGLGFQNSKKNQERLRWTYAWNLQRTNQNKLAEEEFKKLIPMAESIYAKRKYKFWYAKVLEKNKKLADAHKAYEEIAEDDLYGYYGMLTYRERGLKIPALRKLKMNSEPDDPRVHEPDTMIEWLLSVGEIQIAQAYLDQIKMDYDDIDNYVQQLRYYVQAGYYLGLFKRISVLSENFRNKVLAKYPDFFFPRPYSGIIQKYSKQLQVREELIYSIIRQESAFDRYARSPADAFGLMQILPREAKEMAQKVGIEIQEDEDLYIPEKNIAAGTSYLKELRDAYQGQFVMTVASYNAAAKAVKGWVKTRYRGEPLIFIEDIPYEETKGYIKLVLRNLIMYSRLNAGTQELDFPDWAFENLSNYL